MHNQKREDYFQTLDALCEKYANQCHNHEVYDKFHSECLKTPHFTLHDENRNISNLPSNIEYQEAKKPKLRTAKTPNERVAEFSSENIEVKVHMDKGKTRDRNGS